MKKAIIIIVIVIVFAGLGVLLYLQDVKSGVNSNGELPAVGQEFSDEGKEHVADGTQVTYKTNPPTSGNHYAQPANWGIYQGPLPDEQLVHNLEHGGIWISYKPSIDADTKAKLEDIARSHPNSVIITPREANDVNIALASWNRLDKFDTFDRDRIEKFIKHNINKSPEPLAR